MRKAEQPLFFYLFIYFFHPTKPQYKKRLYFLTGSIHNTAELIYDSLNKRASSCQLQMAMSNAVAKWLTCSQNIVRDPRFYQHRERLL